MANDLNLKLKIVADAQGAQDELAGVARQVEQLGDSGTTSAVSLQGLTNALFSLELVQNILSKVGGKLADIANLADQYNTLQARLRLVTDSTTEYSQALDSVQGIALATRADLRATGDLYATLSRSLKALGEDTRQAADLTSTISQAMQLSGTSSAAAQGAMTQLNQALASGILRGDEFNSLMEQAPRLMQALADSLGVATGQLRGLAEQGKLTAEQVIQALSGQGAAIAKEFSQLPVTIGGATTNLHTQFQILVGSFDDATGASSAVAAAIGGIADHLDALTAAAAAGGFALLARQMPAAAAAVRGYAAEVAAMASAHEVSAQAGL